MKKILLILLILPLYLNAQSEFESFLDHVNSLTENSEKAAAVDSFMNYARTKGIPFIEDSTANYLYQGNSSTNSVSIVGDFNLWNSFISMNRIQGTNFFYLTQNYEYDARLDYKIVVNGNYILDPENPKKVGGGFGPNSELAMPGYVQPWEIKLNPAVAKGTTVSYTIQSDSVDNSFRLSIYLPPGYDTSDSEYPTVYFQDGFDYINLGFSKIIIDNLLDSNKIEPLIAVFVKPNDRNSEYAFSERNKYRKFFVHELVPYIDSNYRTEKDPKRRLVLGDSFGGNISTLIAYNHPDVFANLGIHSGAFQPNDYEANIIFDSVYKPLNIYTVWGSYESYLAKNWQNNIGKIVDKGYEVFWKEYHEGHSWGFWRATLDEMLMYFYPSKTPVNVMDDPAEVFNFDLHQNYPNPFNSSTTFFYNLYEDAQVEIKVFDILGNEIAVLVNEFKKVGNYKIHFSDFNLPSGVYFYRLKTGKLSQTKKMILLK